jgi:hypothetical protein
MCQFMSFFINAKTEQVKVHDLSSHHLTQEKLGLRDDNTQSGCWREGHYLPDGTIFCRTNTLDESTGDMLADSIKDRWPDFKKFLKWAVVGQGAISTEPLSLNSVTSGKDLIIPDGVTWLYLDSVTSAERREILSTIGK